MDRALPRLSAQLPNWSLERADQVVLVTLGCGLTCWEFGSQENNDRSRADSVEVPVQTIRHFVRKGDMLGVLAKRYDTDLSSLRASNHGNDRVTIGQILTIRPGTGFWSSTGGAKFKGMAPPSSGVDFPVGGPEAAGYYNAQGFGENKHLGEDWNGNGGGNTDLGDPVKSVTDGVVFQADYAGKGWGKVVRVLHNTGDNETPRYVESLYGHLDSINVAVGQVINRGQLLGTIGTAEGRYLAHLHLEIRDILDLPIGPGYSTKAKGYLKPTDFIQNNRP